MHPRAVRRAALQLLDEGASLNAVSKQLGVSRSALREWRTASADPRAQRQVCPVEDGVELDQVAYSELLGFYLGDGCISTFRGKHVLRVACDAAYPEIIDNVVTAIGLVKPDGRVFRVPSTGCFHVTSNWKHWPCLFPQHGPGRKHERALALEPWQQEIVELHPTPLLRGLFHSDGCRLTNWTSRVVGGEPKRYEYGRWLFSNNSSDIMRWCQEALDRIGVHWTMPRWNSLSVARRLDVALLDELIGPKT